MKSQIYPKRKNHRLPGYDYTTAGAYFITVCTHDHRCMFGEIIDDEMVANAIGQIVVDEWRKNEVLREKVRLDSFVLMPNHFHGILILENEPARKNNRKEQFGKPTSGTVSTVVRSFKSAVTRRTNILQNSKGAKVWQRGFWDHVVRNEKSLAEIEKYIVENPMKWQLDKLYKRKGE